MAQVVSPTASAEQDGTAEGSAAPLAPPVVLKKGKNLLTYTQELLVQKAARLREIDAARRELDRTERQIREEMDAIVRELGAHGNITQFPTVDQRRMLSIFQKALDSSDMDRVLMAYDLVCTVGAQKTSWRDSDGDYAEVAFAKKVAQFQGVRS